MEKIAYFKTKDEAKKVLGNDYGYVVKRYSGDGYIVSKHKPKCACGMCPVLSTVDTWI